MSNRDAVPPITPISPSAATGMSLRHIVDWCTPQAPAEALNPQAPAAQSVDALISSYLARHGIEEHESLEAYGLSAWSMADLTSGLGWTTLIPRQKLLDEARRTLADNRCVLVMGTVQSGKTSLLRVLVTEGEKRGQYQRRVVLDGMALRGRSYRALNREAIFYLCADATERNHYLPPKASGNGSYALKEPVQATYPVPGVDATNGSDPGYSPNSRLGSSPAGGSNDADPAERALSRYLRSGVIDNGLLVIEHAERIAPGPESERWLSMLLEEGRLRGAQVIVVCASGHPSNMPHRKILEDLPRFVVPDLSLEEIEEGLSQEHLRPYRASGMSARRVHRISGGRPCIVRDLLRFLATECANRGLSGRRALIGFIDRQVEQYSVECQHLIEVLRHRPDSLVKPLVRASPRVLTRALTSGAIVATEKHFAFASLIVAHRYRKLARADNLLWMASTGEPEVILTKSDYPELIGYALANSIRTAATPAVAFARYAQVLRHFGLRNIEIRVRDRDNACLWSRIFEDCSQRAPAEEWRPLDVQSEIEFAKAVRIGRRVVAEAGQIWLPSIGPRGHVEVMTLGSLRENYHSYSGRLKVRTLWNIVLTLESALATATERLLLKRQLRMSSRALYRMQDVRSADKQSKSLMQGLLQQANCNAVVVLDRAGPYWRVADLRVIRLGDPTDWTSLLANANAHRLEEIATHPSGRGLVLGDKELINVFPHLMWRRKSVAMSLNPVCVEGTNSLKLVAFIFVGTSAHDISGARQKQLFLMAPIAVAR